MSEPRLHLLAALGPELQQQFRAAARRRSFVRGERVFHQGDPGDVFHIVEKGRFAIEAITPLGDRIVIRIVGPQEHFGELALTSNSSERTATVTALEPATTLSIQRRDFEELRAASPAVDRLLVAALAQRLKQETELAMELAFVPVATRVARRLLRLCPMYQRPGGRTPVVLPLTQEMLAGIAGTTRATANRAIRALERLGVVELHRGSITILDIAQLRRAADE